MSLRIVLDETRPLLARVRTAAAARGLALVGARAAASLVREHLYGLNAQRHRPGGSNFFRAAGDSVSVLSVPAGAAVNITHRGFRQRLKGGPIKPKPGKMLAIPVEGTAAVGRRPREFSDLDVGRAMDERGRLRWALIRRASTPISYVRRKRPDGTVSMRIRRGVARLAEPLFWLSHGVTQRADPTVLPYDEQMAARAIDSIQTRLRRLDTRAVAEGGGA